MAFGPIRWAGVALALAASAAVAQAPEDTVRWTAINAAWPAPAAEEARNAIVSAEADCPGEGAVLGVITPATAWRRIDEAIRSGQLANGWVVTVQRPQCPAEDATARFVLLRDAAGNLSAQLIHVGRSHIDLDTMADSAMPKALRTAANTAARDVPGCSPEYVSRSAGLLRTEVVDDAAIGPERFGVRRSGGWREQWLFGVCGRTLSVFLDFEGGPDGTKVTVSPWASLRR